MRRDTTANGAAGQRNDRHKYNRLVTRQPEPIIEAINVIAKKRKTAVATIIGEAAAQAVKDARVLLPKKLQHKLRKLGLDL